MKSKLIRLFRPAGIAMCVAASLIAPRAAAGQTGGAPASLAGTWNMGLVGDHVIPVALVLEQHGGALTGTFILMGRDFPLTGEVVGRRLTLTGKGPAFGRPGGDHNAAVAAGGGEKRAVLAGPARPGENMALADMTITGELNDEGGLAGDVAIKLSEGTGTIKWTAERLKERKVPASQAVSPDVNLTGAWTMAIVEAQLQLDVALTQTGTKVTGSAMSDHLGKMTIEGTFGNGTLSFVSVGSVSGQEVRIEYSGRYLANGTLAGELTSQMGAMTWTAARVKK